VKNDASTFFFIHVDGEETRNNYLLVPMAAAASIVVVVVVLLAFIFLYGPLANSIVVDVGTKCQQSQGYRRKKQPVSRRHSGNPRSQSALENGRGRIER
jgi:hypothetical protein